MSYLGLGFCGSNGRRILLVWVEVYVGINGMKWECIGLFLGRVCIGGLYIPL